MISNFQNQLLMQSGHPLSQLLPQSFLPFTAQRLFSNPALNSPFMNNQHELNLLSLIQANILSKLQQARPTLNTSPKQMPSKPQTLPIVLKGENDLGNTIQIRNNSLIQEQAKLQNPLVFHSNSSDASTIDGSLSCVEQASATQSEHILVEEMSVTVSPPQPEKKKKVSGPVKNPMKRVKKETTDEQTSKTDDIGMDLFEDLLHESGDELEPREPEETFRPTKHFRYLGNKLSVAKRVMPKREAAATTFYPKETKKVNSAEVVKNFIKELAPVMGYENIDSIKVHEILIRSEMCIPEAWKKVRKNLGYYKKALRTDQ
jgi:hypothetical protein